MAAGVREKVILVCYILDAVTRNFQKLPAGT